MDNVPTPRITAMVPARQGSKGLAVKNLQQVNGHPLVSYAVEAAKQAELITDTIVLTDSQEIADEAVAYGATLPCLLPEEITQDHSRLEETFAFMTKHLMDKGEAPDYVCFVDPTRPVRPPGFLDEAIRGMLEGRYDSVISGVKEHKSIWRKSGDNLERLDSGFTVRQRKKDKLFICYSGLITCTKASYMAAGERLGEKILIHEFDDFNMTIDIHVKDELTIADFILREWADRYIIPKRLS